jgi:hypothetical protein
MTNKEPIKTVKHGKPCWDYGTRVVPDDEFNGLDIGYGWRKHWTILCPVCLTPSPYVCGLDGGNVETEDGTLRRDLWSLECPKCHCKWVWEDSYYDDEF